MRNTLTIAGKELQSYFVQPVAYVVLTVVLLLCLLPVLAAYVYWSVERSNVYVNELRQSARAVSSGLAPSVDEEVIANEFDKVDDAFRKMDAEGTRSALLRKDGTLWRSLPNFPPELVDAARVQVRVCEHAYRLRLSGVLNL